MYSPLISVIVPVYKVEKYLDRCIQSIVDQTYSNLEIILVDDGSPDNCPAICDAWAEKDSRIKVLHKDNEGVADARNTGLKAVTGEFVTFVDSDDWIDKYFYEILFNKMIECDCDMVVSKYRIVEDENEIHNDLVSGNAKIIDMNQAMGDLLDDDKIWQIVWNKIYKKEIVSNVVFESGKIHEDIFWMYLVVAKANRICVLDYYGYNYFQRADSIMGVGFSTNRLDAVEAKCYRQNYLEKHLPDFADKGRVALHFSCIYVGQQAIKSMSCKESKEIIKRLNYYTEKYPVSFKLAKKQGFVSMVYLQLEKISLSFVCRLRNILGIGM